MTKPIRRVGVIGAGVMGSGIAAHLANAGVHALLLDIVPPAADGGSLGKPSSAPIPPASTDAEKTVRESRNRFAQGGLDKALKARPAAFFHPSLARLVEI